MLITLFPGGLPLRVAGHAPVALNPPSTFVFFCFMAAAMEDEMPITMTRVGATGVLLLSAKASALGLLSVPSGGALSGLLRAVRAAASLAWQLTKILGQSPSYSIVRVAGLWGMGEWGRAWRARV